MKSMAAWNNYKAAKAFIDTTLSHSASAQCIFTRQTLFLWSVVIFWPPHPPQSFPSNDYVIYEPPLGKLVSAKWSHRVEYNKERQHAKTQNVISPGTVAPTTFLPSSWISTDVAWRKCFTLNRASVMLCNWGMCYAIVGNKKYELNNPGIIVTKNGVIVYNHALWARSEENRGNHSDTPFSLQNKIIQPNHAYCLPV